MRRRVQTAIVLALAFGGAFAQDRPLREDQITEAAVAEALGVPEAAPDGVRTRGFKLVTPRPPGAPRQASLLITFLPNSDELQQSARVALDKVGRVLRSEKLTAASFRIEGHADPRGSDALNAELSKRRADSVVTYLVREHGIPPERLEAVGKGSTELLNTRDPTAPENRRVTIVVR